jgi:putative membrane protein
MYIYRHIRWDVVLSFAWRYLIFYLIYGAIIVFAYHYFDHNDINIGIPFLPISTIGIAVAFYLGFKNNQSYDRFWEARKIWGGIVNYSRTWGNQVMSYVTNLHASETLSSEELHLIHRRLIYRHIAWLNALRLQLRVPSTFSLSEMKRANKKMYAGRPGGEDWNRDVAPYLSCMDETDVIQHKVNTATQIIRAQGADCLQLRERELMDDFCHMEMMHTLEEFYNLQGKCERIKNTPLPRQYSYFSMVFVWIFVLLLPFGLVGEFAAMGHGFMWLTVPFYMLIAWIFMTMELVGDNSEDPFENFVNDVPMTALCRTIEIDLRDMLDEKDLPPKIEPVDGILM